MERSAPLLLHAAVCLAVLNERNGLQERNELQEQAARAERAASPDILGEHLVGAANFSGNATDDGQQPQLSSIWPTGGALSGGMPVTIWGAGFGPSRQPNGGACRFGAGPAWARSAREHYTKWSIRADRLAALAEQHEPGTGSGVTTAGQAINESAFTCLTPAWPAEAGIIPVEVSLGDDDFVGATPAPLEFALHWPVVLSEVIPSGGPTAGGTMITVVGNGFDQLGRYGAASLCSVGPSNSLTSATRLAGQIARCSSPPAAAPDSAYVRLSMNGVEFSPSLQAEFAESVRFSFYEPPILVQLRPASGPVAGSQLVSVVAIGLENHGGTMDARCMFGDTVVPAHTKTRSAIVCSTPRLRGAQAATTAIGVRLSINAADFTDEELVYEYHDPLYNQTGE